METKEQLINTIREWVKLDNEIRYLQKTMTTKKKEKKDMSLLLIETMKQNDIDCFDINDGQICYTTKNVRKPMTKKVLFDTLTKYFEGDIIKATEINNFICDNRIQETQETIVRKIKTANV
jgi:hypothetical protein